jgi:hypothetical protein
VHGVKQRAHPNLGEIATMDLPNLTRDMTNVESQLIQLRQLKFAGVGMAGLMIVLCTAFNMYLLAFTHVIKYLPDDISVAFLLEWVSKLGHVINISYVWYVKAKLTFVKAFFVDSLEVLRNFVEYDVKKISLRPTNHIVLDT